MFKVIMPKAGMTMEEGTIIKWLKNEGERVQEGEDILTIETNKITMEEPAPGDGILLKILYKEGDIVPVSTVIAYIGEEGELSDVSDRKTEAPAEVRQPEKFEQKIEAPRPNKIMASPAAKQLAKESGIELSLMRQAANGDVVKKKDIAEYIKSASAETQADKKGNVCENRVKIEGMRRTIYSRMSKSHAEVAASLVTIQADVTKMLSLRRDINFDTGRHVTVNDFVLKAAANTLKAYPAFNASIDGEYILMHEHINICVAVGIEGLLIVPVIKNADRLNLFDISGKVKSLVEKVKGNSLLPDDLDGGTFTVSNLGMYGINHFTPIVNLPQVAILGVCAVQRYFSEAGKSTDGMNLCLTYDHRVLNGVESAMFLCHLKEQLEKPLGLVL
ncbi:MAG: 2-oxo acid dehydrogenase subunit E2 [Anaerolineaceae bacterium]|nr:MAG: 2-oxo acid dehydrogenase subunit E2 [Anaerolineaceae bacterium]